MMRSMVTLAAGVTEDANGPWEFSCEGTLRLRAEEQYLEKPVINDPQDDMVLIHGARSLSIVEIESWENGGVAAYTNILDMRRKGHVLQAAAADVSTAVEGFLNLVR